MFIFDVTRHFWVVAGDETRLWSSAAAAYVPAGNAAYQDWRAADGLPTRIASEKELSDALLPYGLVGPYLASVAELAAIDQATLNAKLAEPGGVVRGLALVLLQEVNTLRAKAGLPTYTPGQLVTALQAKMR